MELIEASRAGEVVYLDRPIIDFVGLDAVELRLIADRLKDIAAMAEAAARRKEFACLNAL